MNTDKRRFFSGASVFIFVYLWFSQCSRKSKYDIDLYVDIAYDIYMMRIVLDTDVVIAAMRSPTGASAAILRLVDVGQIRLLCSVALLLEYEAKCTLPLHYNAAGLSHEDALVFVDGIAAMAEPVELHFVWRPQLRDPDDEMVLETAINGGADLLVTFNVRDYGEMPRRFGVETLRPAQAIQRMRS